MSEDFSSADLPILSGEFRRLQMQIRSGILKVAQGSCAFQIPTSLSLCHRFLRTLWPLQHHSKQRPVLAKKALRHHSHPARPFCIVRQSQFPRRVARRRLRHSRKNLLPSIASSPPRFAFLNAQVSRRNAGMTRCCPYMHQPTRSSHQSCSRRWRWKHRLLPC